MTASAAAKISPTELDQLLDSSKPPRVVDVRTPAEFETAHIPGSFNVPLDVLREHQSEIADHLTEDVVLVCKSGQRAATAQELLRSGRVLENGFIASEGNGSAVDRGTQRWDLERRPVV
jgi:rhodanese-related sulfurtransferase